MNFCVAVLISKMEENKPHFQHIMLYYFKKGKNATETQEKICTVYGEEAVTDRTCQKWFAKFRAGDFSLDDAPRSGRPVEVDSDQIETLIVYNQCCTTENIQIDKVIGENFKMCLILQKKTKQTFWPIQYLDIVLIYYKEYALPLSFISQDISDLLSTTMNTITNTHIPTTQF